MSPSLTIQFIVVGVDKCGTSALAKFLMQHSKVSFLGETYFFNRDYGRGLEYYKLLGAGVPSENTLFEKSPTYYKSLTVPKYIRDMDPKTKIVLVTCNNVRRLLSRYSADYIFKIYLIIFGRNIDQFNSTVESYRG